MKLNTLFKAAQKSLCRMAGKAVYIAKEYKPEILITIGITSVVGGTIVACCETATKMKPVMDEFGEQLNRVKDDKQRSDEIAETNPDMVYPIKQYRKDITMVYRNLFLQSLKVYALAIILSSFGIACICRSNAIMRKRNIALGAAYTALDQAFKKYREEVKARYGEAVDEEIRLGIHRDGDKLTMNDEQITKIKEDPKSLHDACQILLGPDDIGHGVYQSNPTYTLQNVECIRRALDDELERWGYITVNDIRKKFGYSPIPELEEYGCVFDKSGLVTSSHVDFGLYTINKQKTIDFINGEEDFLLIDIGIHGHIPTIVGMIKSEKKEAVYA